MRRVVITGMGLISSLGHSTAEVRQALREGRSGVVLLPERRELGFHSCLAGTVKGFEAPKLAKKHLRHMGEGGRMAMAASQQAIGDADLTEEQVRDDRTGVVIGNSGNMHDVYQNCHAVVSLKQKLSGMALPKTMASSVSANLSVVLGTRGHCMTVSNACASGATAIGQAALLIRFGLQDRAIAGGVQEGSWELDCNFDALRVFSRREEAPAEASRPFDKHRDGLVPSCGAGMVVLEDYEQARRRGARIYAELIGYGTNADGFDMTTASGTGGVKCMELALADAGIAPDRVDYVNAHATSTPVGDALEARSIAKVFGKRPFVSSTKSMTGHEIAAAGSNEIVYTLLMMTDRFVAPSINIEELDEACSGINVVANEAIDRPIGIALSNSFGFGGVNATLIVGRTV
jgi:3-oxoacyl-[acyl-carrier-protein] synthase-1